MNEQLRFHTGPATMGRRSRSAVPARRIDTRTLEIGRRGVAKARSILAAHRWPDHDPTPPIQVADAARTTAVWADHRIGLSADRPRPYCPGYRDGILVRWVDAGGAQRLQD